jgi:hypothetical protein
MWLACSVTEEEEGGLFLFLFSQAMNICGWSSSQLFIIVQGLFLISLLSSYEHMWLVLHRVVHHHPGALPHFSSLKL